MLLKNSAVDGNLSYIINAVYISELKSACASVPPRFYMQLMEENSTQVSGTGNTPGLQHTDLQESAGGYACLDIVIVSNVPAEQDLVVQTRQVIDEPFLLLSEQLAKKQNLVNNLGWSREQAFEARSKLIAFEEDWNAPGMEAYDAL